MGQSPVAGPMLSCLAAAGANCTLLAFEPGQHRKSSKDSFNEADGWVTYPGHTKHKRRLPGALLELRDPSYPHPDVM